jgi:hypothetical protein
MEEARGVTRLEVLCVTAAWMDTLGEAVRDGKAMAGANAADTSPSPVPLHEVKTGDTGSWNQAQPVTQSIPSYAHRGEYARQTAPNEIFRITNRELFSDSREAGCGGIFQVPVVGEYHRRFRKNVFVQA